MIGRICNTSTALFRAVLLIFAFSLCLGACTAPAPAEPQAAAPAVQPQTAEPEPEPLPEMTDGPAVTVNGQRLNDGSWLIEEVLYVRLWSLTQALDTDLTWDGQTAAFLWHGHEICLEAGSSQLLQDGEPIPLDAPLRRILDEAYVPLESLAAHLLLGCYTEAETGHLYFTPGAAKFEVPAGYAVPTLMYHAVSDDLWGDADLFVSPAELEKQLQYLLDNGYTPIHFGDLAYVDEIEKPVLLTFDDGYADNYHELFPLLQQYGVKATIFVITGSLDNHHLYMTWEQAKEMADSGLVSIQSHTVDHPFLSGLSAEGQAEQMEASKLAILQHTGYEPYVLCYPTGVYDANTLAVIGDYYHFGLKMNGDAWYTDENVYEINRWFVSRYTTLDRFIEMLES